VQGFGEKNPRDRNHSEDPSVDERKIWQLIF